MTSSYRFPGLKPYTYQESSLFFGRDEDISNLRTSVAVNPTTLLFGKSGTGKSSLIQAGLIPALNQNNDSNAAKYRSVTLLPKVYSYGTDDNLLDKIARILRTELKTSSENLLNPDKVKSPDCIWYLLKQCQYQMQADEEDQFLLLIFDQAEELFTYPEVQLEKFVNELEPVLGNFIPDDFYELIREQRSELSKEAKLILNAPLPVKIIFSIRSDKLHLVTRLKKASPLILQNSYELLPLTRSQANKAIDGPSKIEGGVFSSSRFEIEGEAKNYIFDDLTSLADDPELQWDSHNIEPFSLQIVCSHIEKRLVPKRNHADHLHKISLKDLLGGHQPNDIINDYYMNTLENLEVDHKHLPDDLLEKVRTLIEERMISDNRRVPIHRKTILNDEDINVNVEILEVLVEARILSKNLDSYGDAIYEVTHDCLIEPITKAKTERKSESFFEIKIRDLLKKIRIEEQKLEIWEGTRGPDSNSPNRDSSNPVSQDNKLQVLDDSRQISENHGLVIKNDEQLADMYLDAGDFYFSIRDFNQAVQYYQKAQNTSAYRTMRTKAKEILPKMASAHHSMGQFDKAIKALEKILKENPDEKSAIKLMLECYFNKNQVEEGITHLQKLKVSQLDIYISLGSLFYGQKDWQRSKEIYQKIIELDPGNHIFYYDLGLIEENLGNKELAASNYRKLLSFDPKDESTLIRLAAIYFNNQDFENAKEIYKQLVEINPNNEANFHDLGLIEESLGNKSEAENCFNKSLEINPNYEKSLVRISSIYWESKDWNKTREIYLHLLEINPNNVAYYHDLGLIEEFSEDQNKAMEYHQKALEINPDYEKSLIRLAGLYFSKTNWKEAEKIYQRLIQLNPQNELNYHDLGLIYDKMSDLNNSEKYYKKALHLKPDDEMTLVRLSGLYWRNEEWEKAKEIYSQLLDINPSNEAYHTDMEFIEKKLKDPSELEQEFEKSIQAEPNDIKALVGLAGVYWNQNKWEKAKKLYERLILLEPEKEVYYHDLGIIEKNLDRPEAAEKNFRKALELNPRYEKSLLEMSGLYWDREDWANAKELYLRLIAEDPSNEAYYHDLGLLEEHLENPEQAEHFFLKALEFKPDYVKVLVRLAGFYFKEKRWKEAEKIYLQLIEVDIDNWLNYHDLGLINEKMGAFDAAVNYYLKVLDFKPDDEPTLLKLSGIYWNNQDWKNAKVIYEKLLDINPSNDAYLTDLHAIQKKLSDPKETEQEYKRILESDPENMEALIGLSGIYWNQKQWGKSKELYLRMLQIEPSNAIYYHDLGIIEENLGNLGQAEKHYLQALNLNQDYEKVLNRLAGIYWGRKDWPRAKEIYERLILIAPYYEAYLHDLGLIEENLGQLDTAELYYIKALDVHPDYDKALIRLASLYFKAQRWQDALEKYLRLNELDPGNELYLYDLGMIEEKLNRPDKAENYYLQVLKITPKDEPTLVRISGIYWDKRDWKNAKDIYRKLLLINPLNEVYQKNIKTIDQNLQNPGP